MTVQLKVHGRKGRWKSLLRLCKRSAGHWFARWLLRVLRALASRGGFRYAAVPVRSANNPWNDQITRDSDEGVAAAAQQMGLSRVHAEWGFNGLPQDLVEDPLMGFELAGGLSPAAESHAM